MKPLSVLIDDDDQDFADGAIETLTKPVEPCELLRRLEDRAE
jgi:hypothetical protein